jgi:PAS domain S-box-containing protein
MDNRAFKITPASPPSFVDQGDRRTEQCSPGCKTSIRSHTPKPSNEHVVPLLDDAGDIFTHAPVSLWEEDFSEVKRRFDQLKANGVEDLRKHFKKHPEEVLSLARMVRIVRVNEATLKLFDATGPVEFQEGLSRIFSKDSYEIFKDEVIAFWKGRPSFTSESVNVTLTGTSKNILIHAHVPPGFEHTWAKVYVAITDITAIKDSMRGLAASEQKYRSLFDTVHTAVLIADMPSGMIVEANRSAKRLFGASNGDLVGLHLADLVPREEQDRIRALLRQQPERPGPAGPVLHVIHRSNGTVPVCATASTIEIGDEQVAVVSFIPADEGAPARSANRKARDHYAGLGRKITQREREILRLICSGKTSRAIAQHLCISDKTVETHRSRIMQKLDTHCVVDLVKFAMANGLAQLQ